MPNAIINCQVEFILAYQIDTSFDTSNFGEKNQC